MSCHVDRLRCCQLRGDGQCDKSVRLVGHQFITLTFDICVQHGGRKAPRRAGVSVVEETERFATRFLTADEISPTAPTLL